MIAGPAPHTRLVLFSGLGADGRLFEPQRRGLAGVRVETPAWLEPLDDRETIHGYAQRTAATIEPPAPEERLFVGGVSLGAIVALEAARHVPARGVFMIGGCRRAAQLAPFFRFACELARRVPVAMVKPILWGGPLALTVFESLSWDHMRLYAAMLRDASPRQVRWSAGAIADWQARPDPPGLAVYEMHGQRDLIIPRRNVDAEYVVHRGRHLISLSRAAEVNRFLLAKMGVGSPAREGRGVPVQADASPAGPACRARPLNRNEDDAGDAPGTTTPVTDTLPQGTRVHLDGLPGTTTASDAPALQRSTRP